jgi:uncharacterized membrane protein
MPEDQTAMVTRTRLRLENLSDLIFGLALSIGSISLILNLPDTATEMENDIAVFGFSFIIIIGVWLSYTRTTSLLNMEAPGSVYVNVVLLFCVALEPFLFYVVEKVPETDITFLDFASSAYGLNTGLMMGLLAGMVYLALSQDGKHQPKFHPALVRRMKYSMAGGAIASALFLISVLPVFWVNIETLGYLRFDLWYIAIVAIFAGRGVLHPDRSDGSAPPQEKPVPPEP